MGKSEHTFYKEAKKSFLGEDSFSWSRILKSFLKYFKWALYTFLIMTSLWGCVNQFRHSTSGSVSQGLEFYSSYDAVLPNLYVGEESSHTYEIYENYIDDESNEVSEKVPLEFYTINSNYNPDVAAEDRNPNVNYDDLFIRFSEKTDQSGNPINSILSYVVNEGAASFYLFNYDWSFYTDVTNLNGIYGPTNPNGIEWVVPWLSLPPYISDSLTDKNSDEIIDMTDFYLSIGFTSDDGTGLLTEDEEGNIDSVTVFEKFIVPSITKSEMETDSSWWMTSSNWTVIDGSMDASVSSSEWSEFTQDEKNEVAKDQTVYYTNAVSYMTGSSFKSTDSLTLTINDQEVTTTIEEVILNAYPGSQITGHYTASFPVFQDVSLYSSNASSTYELYSGLGYSIVPQNKASPLYPTQDTISTFRNYDVHGNPSSTGMRDPNWYEGTDGGTDARTQNAGWVMLDSEGEFIPIYSSDDQSTNYLYGDKQSDFDSNLQSYRTSTEESGYYVDNNLSASFGIDNENNVSVDNYQEDFIGVSSIADIDLASNDETTRTVQNLTYNSTIKESIKQSGQSGTNSDRDIFASWGDWGDAWDPSYGPMYGLFVFPLSQLSLFVNSWFPYQVFGAWGVVLGIFIITFLLRGIGLLLSFGSSKNQQKMQEVQPLLAEIDAKYSMYDKTNKQMKAKKQQEKMALYKKHEINPFASLGTVFITLPIFLSLFTIISAIPIYKVASVGAFSFSVSSFYGMFNISSLFLIYLLVGLTVGFAQGVSTKLPGWLSNKRRGVKQVDDATKKAMKKQRRTQNILVGVFIFIGLTVSVLLAIYWIFSALFSITNEMARHLSKERKAKKIAQGKV